MTRHVAPEDGSFDSIRYVYPPRRVKVIEVDEEGNRTEHIEEGHVSQIGPAARPNQPTESKPRAVPTSPFLRMEEATTYVRAGKKRLLRWVRRGLLPETVDPDGRRFFKREDLDAVMGKGAVPPEPIASNATPRKKGGSQQKPWLSPTYPRTRPRDPERR